MPDLMSFGLEAADIADFGDDTSRIDIADTRDRNKRVIDDFKLLRNGLVQNLDLTLQRPHSGDGDRHDLVYGIIDGSGQTVGASGRCLNSFGCGNAIEGRNGISKRRFGLDRIFSKLDETAKTEAALILLAMNASHRLVRWLALFFRPLLLSMFRSRQLREKMRLRVPTLL